MRDEEYFPEQIPSYGTHEQPVLAERTRPLLRRLQIGNGFAGLAVLAALIALLTFPTNLFDQGPGRGWAIAALACSVVLLGICTFQHAAWVRAMAVWRDERQTDVRQLAAFTLAAEIAAYVVVAVALWVCIAGVLYAGWSATASVFLLLSLLAMLVAHVLAGVQNVRVSGPPGTVPAHMRRVVNRENQRDQKRTPIR